MIRYYRKIIQIKATDSPNVRLGLAEVAAGKEPSHRELVPGVLTYAEYLKRKKLWDPIRRCISLGGDFHEGAEDFLFPPEWLNKSEEIAETLRGHKRTALSIGVDPAAGGDETSMVAIDRLGVIELVSKKTPDTSVTTGETLAFMKKHGAKPSQVWFDAGGGGQQHVDRLRRQGHKVNAVAFGAAATPEKKRGLTAIEKTKEQDTIRYAYRNRRAEMYGITSILLDPSDGVCFAIPREYSELRRQLAPIPRAYDGEGRLKLPPKRKDPNKPNVVTMSDLIGRSPDDADALVLAAYGMVRGLRKVSAGALFR